MSFWSFFSMDLVLFNGNLVSALGQGNESPLERARVRIKNRSTYLESGTAGVFIPCWDRFLEHWRE
jgi:hypothetical protein